MTLRRDTLRFSQEIKNLDRYQQATVSLAHNYFFAGTEL